jgi:uncharacterized protein
VQLSRNSRIHKEFFDSRRGHSYNSRLMSKRQERLPVEVDPFRFAEARRLLEGEIPLKQMKRLVPLLASDSGSVHVSLEFGIDSMGVVNLVGDVQADLALICQRCLEPMDWSLKLSLALAFLRPNEDEAAIPGPYEPYVVDALPVRLTDMIEDEIILALPSIPRHDLAQCPAGEWVQDEKPAAKENAAAENRRDNPFSVLAELNTPNKGK